MLAALLVAGQLAAQEPPRFTMTPASGDALTAELFRLDPDRAEAQVRALLGQEAADGDGAGEEASPFQGGVLIRSSGPLSMAYREGTLPAGPIVLYAGPDADHAPDAACRLTRRPGGTVDNSERATQWCLSFVLKLAPTLVIPPAPVH
ncbi:MAG: hypothetical protein J0I52_10020 [Bordetella sp.]|nr:hypothetical protein [Bordetella sp.]